MNNASDGTPHLALARLTACALLLLGCARVRADELMVSAAASLTNAFGEIGKAYERVHPGEHVIFNFAASDVALKQIEQGAPADVFASADEATMDRAAAAALIDATTRRDFATNTLVLIVPAGAAKPISLSELAGAFYTHVAIGNPDSVPAGRYAREALAGAKLWDRLQLRLVEAQNVRQVLDYVARGEAQAGFVYASDAATQNASVAVALTLQTSTLVRYPLAIVKSSAHAAQALAFIEFVSSPASRAMLQRHGFGAASP